MKKKIICLKNYIYSTNQIYFFVPGLNRQYLITRHDTSEDRKSKHRRVEESQMSQYKTSLLRGPERERYRPDQTLGQRVSTGSLERTSTEHCSSIAPPTLNRATGGHYSNNPLLDRATSEHFPNNAPLHLDRASIGHLSSIAPPLLDRPSTGHYASIVPKSVERQSNGYLSSNALPVLDRASIVLLSNNAPPLLDRASTGHYSSTAPINVERPSIGYLSGNALPILDRAANGHYSNNTAVVLDRASNGHFSENVPSILDRALHEQFSCSSPPSFRVSNDRPVTYTSKDSNYLDRSETLKRNSYDNPPKPPPRRNGFITEDIYARHAANIQYKTKTDYASPYKPIKPEFLTLPSEFSTNKYSTLPKSWSVSSSNSYKNYFPPIRSATSTTTDIKSYDYRYPRAPRDNYYNYKGRPSKRQVVNERYFEKRGVYPNETGSPLSSQQRQYERVEATPRYSAHNESDKLTPRPRKIRVLGQKLPGQEDGFYKEKPRTQQQERSNVYRKSEYETKKNVTFSEVSGCEERNNIVGVGHGGKGVYVRELEVSFNQVINKTNIGRETVKEVKQNQHPWQNFSKNPPAGWHNNEKIKAFPNGHYMTGGVVDQARNGQYPGTLPMKLAQPTGFFSGLKRKKYLSQV